MLIEDKNMEINVLKKDLEFSKNKIHSLITEKNHFQNNLNLKQSLLEDTKKELTEKNIKLINLGITKLIYSEILKY